MAMIRSLSICALVLLTVGCRGWSGRQSGQVVPPDAASDRRAPGGATDSPGRWNGRREFRTTTIAVEAPPSRPPPQVHTIAIHVATSEPVTVDGAPTKVAKLAG